MAHGAAEFRVAQDSGDWYDLVMQNDEVMVHGDWGYALGTYSGNDKYLSLVRREADGEWRMANGASHGRSRTAHPTRNRRREQDETGQYEVYVREVSSGRTGSVVSQPSRPW